MRSKAFLSIIYIFTGISVLPAQPNVTAWDVLMDAVHNAKNPEHRKQAVAAIAVIGPAPEAVKVLEEVLQKDQEPMVRQAAAFVLGDMRATQAIPALKRALDDDSGEVAFSAAKALWDLGDPNGKATFEEILTQERKSNEGFLGGTVHDVKLKMRDPKKLALMGVKEASGAMLGPYSMGFNIARDAMKDNGAPGRALAAEYMAKDCDARAVQLLEWALKEDNNWLVKAASARGLGKCGDTPAIPYLEKYLNDSHEPLKYQAAAAIVRLSIKAAPTSTAANVQP